MTDRLQWYYEQEPAYQFSSARVFFSKHVEELRACEKIFDCGQKLNPGNQSMPLTLEMMQNLEWRMTVGLEEMIFPSDQLERPN